MGCQFPGNCIFYKNNEQNEQGYTCQTIKLTRMNNPSYCLAAIPNDSFCIKIRLVCKMCKII